MSVFLLEIYNCTWIEGCICVWVWGTLQLLCSNCEHPCKGWGRMCGILRAVQAALGERGGADQQRWKMWRRGMKCKVMDYANPKQAAVYFVFKLKWLGCSYVSKTPSRISSLDQVPCGSCCGEGVWNPLVKPTHIKFIDVIGPEFVNMRVRL